MLFSLFYHLKNSTQKQCLQPDCVTFNFQISTKKMVYIFFQGNTSRKFLQLLLFYLPVFCLQLSSASAIIPADFMVFPVGTPSPLFRVCVRGGWVLVYKSGSNISACQLHKGKQHEFLCFLLFLYLYFYFLSRISKDIGFFFLIPSARSLRFGN